MTASASLSATHPGQAAIKGCPPQPCSLEGLRRQLSRCQQLWEVSWVPYCCLPALPTLPFSSKVGLRSALLHCRVHRNGAAKPPCPTEEQKGVLSPLCTALGLLLVSILQAQGAFLPP